MPDLTEEEREALRTAVRVGIGTMPGSYVGTVMAEVERALRPLLTEHRAAAFEDGRQALATKMRERFGPDACWCGPQLSHDHDPRVQDCPSHGDGSGRYFGDAVLDLLPPAPVDAHTSNESGPLVADEARVERLVERIHAGLWGCNIPAGMTGLNPCTHTTDPAEREGQREFIRRVVRYAIVTGGLEADAHTSSEQEDDRG